MTHMKSCVKAKNTFYEITKLHSVHHRVQLNVCARCNESVLLNYCVHRRGMYRRHENKMPPATALAGGKA